MVDFINALFEFGAALFIFNHCRVVLKDRSVAGVSILSTFVFFLWGLWNMYYYPSLNQYASFYAGLFIVVANACWVFLLLKYRKRHVKKKSDPNYSLTLHKLAESNAARAKEWGEWNENESLVELMGELGELANLQKKINRCENGMRGNGISTIEDLLLARDKEAADVLICLDNYCRVAGIFLERVTIDKFNETSRKNDFEVFL